MDRATARVLVCDIYGGAHVLLSTAPSNRGWRVGRPFEQIGDKRLSRHARAHLPRLMPLIDLLLIIFGLIAREDRKDARKWDRHKRTRAVRPLKLTKKISM